MPAISQIAGVVEPQRRYNWEVSITRAPAGVNFPENMKLRARSTSIPGKEFDTIEINYRWMTWRVTGREAGGKEITLSFWEGVDQAVRNAFIAWTNAVGDWESGRQGTKEEVSGEIVLKLLDGSENVVKTIVLKNAMLVSVDGVDVDYNASEVVEYTARIVYDYFTEA